MKTILTLLLFFYCSHLQANRIILTTHDLNPYSYYDSKGQLTGSAVEVVRCVMKQLREPYEIRVVPWKRAQFLVHTDQAHGFFAASRNYMRDRYAELSEIIAEQKWTWYLLADSPFDPKSDSFKTEATVTSFLGANMHSWLEGNGYKVFKSPPRNNQLLLDMLLHKRVDAILANDQVMGALIKQNELGSSIREVVNINKSLGVYF